MAQILALAVSATQERNAGIAKEQEATATAAAEGDAARQREIGRRRALVRALASQNARAGATGLQTDGSIGSLIRSDINDASNDLLVDRANSQQRIASLRASGKAARRAGDLGAIGSLLDSGTKLARAGI